MQFIDELRKENDARREALIAEEAARQAHEQQTILDDAKALVKSVADQMVREAENGECLALPLIETMKYEPEKTLWMNALLEYAKEEGINLCVDYNFGVMEFSADPRSTDCARLHEAYEKLTAEIAANYAEEATATVEYVKQRMRAAVQEGTGSEKSVEVFLRLLEVTPGADRQPNLFANWKSSLEFMQYTTAADMLRDLKTVETAEQLKAIFTTEENRLLKEGQALHKMIYAVWQQAEEAGLTVIQAGEWMPFANMTVSILLFSAEL